MYISIIYRGCILMIKKITKEKEVVSSLTDCRLSMGLLETQSVIQDNMCDFFQEIGADGVRMVPIKNCFFVVTKSKIVFTKKLTWQDKFSATSEVSSMTRLKVNLCTELTSEEGLVAVCVQEMVAIDADKRTPCLVASTLFPLDLECGKKCDLDFERMVVDIEDSCYVGSHVVDVTNIDFYKHTNNMEYIRFMLTTLDLDYVLTHDIESFEIHYIAESRFGDELKIYRKEIDDGYYFQINNGEKVVVKARMCFSKDCK